MLLGPLPPSDSRAEGERGPAGFWFCHDEICLIPPSCRFLIYPPFPIKACNPPPQIFHQLHTSWSSNYHNCNKICVRRFLYLKPEYTTEFESTWAITLKQLLASGSGKIFFNNFLDLVSGIIEQYSLSLQRIIVSYKENNFSANSFN